MKESKESIAFVFPGQGSQFVGMLSDIAAEFPQVQAVFSEASDVLGYDLWKLTQVGPAEALDQTVYTQPALLAADYALWALLKDKVELKPSLMAGHSLGEYAALVCAEALTFTDGIRLVAARGQFMQDAAPMGVGGLGVIIGLENDDVADICQKAALKGEVLSPANFNSPGQVVIAGHLDAVSRALVLAKAAGSRMAKLLPVSVSSHCDLMRPAAENMATLLETITLKLPIIPVMNNVDVIPYSSIAAIRDGLLRQLYRPVRWVETIEAFSAQGITHIIECGPGKVLNGLNKRINPALELTNAADLVSLQTLLKTPFEG